MPRPACACPQSDQNLCCSFIYMYSIVSNEPLNEQRSPWWDYILWYPVWPCDRAAKALIRLRVCAVWSGPSLSAYTPKTISIINLKIYIDPKKKRYTSKWQKNFFAVHKCCVFCLFFFGVSIVCFTSYLTQSVRSDLEMRIPSLKLSFGLGHTLLLSKLWRSPLNAPPLPLKRFLL